MWNHSFPPDDSAEQLDPLIHSTSPCQSLELCHLVTRHSSRLQKETWDDASWTSPTGNLSTFLSGGMSSFPEINRNQIELNLAESFWQRSSSYHWSLEYSQFIADVGISQESMVHAFHGRHFRLPFRAADGRCSNFSLLVIHVAIQPFVLPSTIDS